MKKSLLRATILLATSLVITAFVYQSLPEQRVEMVVLDGSFEQYLAQFPKKELPFAIDSGNLIQYMNMRMQHRYWMAKLPENTREQVRDSLERLEAQLRHFPEKPRLIRVSQYHWQEPDTLPGDEWMFGHLYYQFFQREEGYLVPIMAFETADYHATLLFAGHSLVDQKDAVNYGRYMLDYFNKKGEKLGGITWASCDGDLILAGSLDKNLHFSRRRYVPHLTTDALTQERHIDYLRPMPLDNWATQYGSDFLKYMDNDYIAPPVNPNAGKKGSL